MFPFLGQIWGNSQPLTPHLTHFYYKNEKKKSRFFSQFFEENPNLLSEKKNSHFEILTSYRGSSCDPLTFDLCGRIIPDLILTFQKCKMEGKDLISNVFLVHESIPKKTPEVRTLVKARKLRPEKSISIVDQNVLSQCHIN